MPVTASQKMMGHRYHIPMWWRHAATAVVAVGLFAHHVIANGGICMAFTVSVQTLGAKKGRTSKIIMSARDDENKHGDDAGFVAPPEVFSRRFLLAGLAGAASSATSASAAFAATRPFGMPGGEVSYGTEDIMNLKAHGSTAEPVQSKLRFGVSRVLADKVCSYNRHLAEVKGYYQDTSFQAALSKANGRPVTFYDSVTGQPLFVAPRGRSAEEFLQECGKVGWPSFRDKEVVWDNVRVLPGRDEVVSVAGTHLGLKSHDNGGNRYSINIVSISGYPQAEVVRASSRIKNDILASYVQES